MDHDTLQMGYGVGWGGDVNVHGTWIMIRCRWGMGWGGVGMLTFMVHYKMQFSKLVKIRKLPKLTGTQCLDQAWNQLKKIVPKELRSRDLKSRRDNERLTQYVMAIMFRWNSKPKLLKAVGQLAKKASR